jgi:hypothetical protein
MEQKYGMQAARGKPNSPAGAGGLVPAALRRGSRRGMGSGSHGFFIRWRVHGTERLCRKTPAATCRPGPDAIRRVQERHDSKGDRRQSLLDSIWKKAIFFLFAVFNRKPRAVTVTLTRGTP